MTSRYYTRCASPLGELLLASDGTSLTGLWMEGQKYYPEVDTKGRFDGNLPVLEATRRWLSAYFQGLKPVLDIPLTFEGTPFRCEVWRLLCQIPYGEVVTYGQLAARLARQRGVLKISARAVGQAVGHNPISIIVPCHRVVGSNNQLTGYAGGLERKMFLLGVEGDFIKSPLQF